jgi:hypothetical protein
MMRCELSLDRAAGAGICADLGASPGGEGGVIITMLPHLGQRDNWPIARSSRTFSRALQVGQDME